MTDEELDALVAKMRMIHEWKLGGEAADTITALRAQLAEMKADRDKWFEGWGTMHVAAMREAQRADQNAIRADRAEAERAAQIEEACAVIDAHAEYDQAFCCDGRECGCQGVSVHDTMKHFIRQPHDRTAIDRMLAEAREKALREAIEAYPKGIGAILAMIKKPDAT